MPRTRAQRRALASSLDVDSVSHVLSFLPELGVLPGRVYTLSGANATRSGLSLKAILAPRRRRIIKCPDDIPLLQNAVAAAREGDVVLLTANIRLCAPIRAPPFRITIAAATRGRYGARARAGPHGIQFRLTEYHGDNFADLDHDSRHPECPEVLIAARYFPGGTNNGDGMFPIRQTAVAAIVATGRSRLDLRGIAWHGTDADQQIFACAAVDATDGARVAIDNCWFSQFGDATLSASGGAELRVRNVTTHRCKNGILAEGDGTSVVVDGGLFNGPHFCAALARAGARVDICSCFIDRCSMAGLRSDGPGSHIRFRETTYLSHSLDDNDDDADWVGRFMVSYGGRMTFPAAEDAVYRWAPSSDRITSWDDPSFEGTAEVHRGSGEGLEGFADLPKPTPLVTLHWLARPHMFASGTVNQHYRHCRNVFANPLLPDEPDEIRFLLA